MSAPFVTNRPASVSSALPLKGSGKAGVVEPVQSECLPDELPGLLDRYGPLKVLSLDCFDTLLWRDCHAPQDIFTTLPGLAPLQRAANENKARIAARAARGVHDVAIDEIYRAAMPRATAGERAAAIEAELAAEARHCYAFAPTVALMREAKQRGLDVVIVSDTYLNPRQLLDLIARAAGSDVAGLIDRVFCSSTFGKPKAGGLYRDVLAKLKIRPDSILHVGDNHGADVGGVSPFGVHTCHLKQFAPEVEQQLRLESAVAAIVNGHGTKALNAPQPHRPALAVEVPRIDNPAQNLGFTTLGPVFAGFDNWLRAEADALRQAKGGRVHWLFLMRDGYLPMRVHQARGADADSHAIEISRFTATYATFAVDTAITRYIEDNRGIDVGALARQLRLDEATIARLATLTGPGEAYAALTAHCRQSHVRRSIMQGAKALADRLVAHVRRVVDPAAGDTLMLVDLGYNGSVQNVIHDLLTRAFSIHLAGRYLLLRETDITGLDKRGYFDESHFDFATLNAMTANVAVVEQLATTAMGSVIDYSAEGAPIRGPNDIKQRQSDVRENVQQGCVAFAGAAARFIHRATPGEDIVLWRKANMATLMRLMFLPLPAELAVIEAFEHDVNLGTSETVALFDPAKAARGLRQQGMFYQKGVRRMYLPAEIAGENLATRLTHLAASRFFMPLTFADFSGPALQVPVIFADPRGVMQSECPASPTHDGWYALCIPIGAGQFTAAIQFARIASHIEIHSITALPSLDYLTSKNDSAEREIDLTPALEGISALTPTLWHCHAAEGFALIQPPAEGLKPAMVGQDLLLVVVFRPVG